MHKYIDKLKELLECTSLLSLHIPHHLFIPFMDLPVPYYTVAEAKAAGLWNLFMPIETDKGQYGAGLTNLEVSTSYHLNSLLIT